MEFAAKVTNACLGRTHIFSVGQAGYIIKSKKGQLLGIDLYLSQCVERVEGHIGFKRLLPQILSPNEFTFDYIIATHPHYDHFDMDSIPILMDNGVTKLYASANCESEVKKLSMKDERIAYVKPGDYVEAGDFKIDFVTCDHGMAAPDAFGVMINVDGKKIFETGDTCLRLDRISEYKKYGDIDILIAPINGAYGNMNEEDCSRLCKELSPKIVIPCHYGMFASHGGNLGLFMEKMKEYCPEKEYLLMMQGEEYIF